MLRRDVGAGDVVSPHGQAYRVYGNAAIAYCNVLFSKKSPLKIGKYTIGFFACLRRWYHEVDQSNALEDEVEVEV